MDSHLRRIDPSFLKELTTLYKDARKRGLWENTYAGTNHAEYWAEGLTDYWDCNREGKEGRFDGVHNHVNTREELKEYDPDLYQFIEEKIGPMEWRYTRYIDRQENK
jgi:hypothetical protein